MFFEWEGKAGIGVQGEHVNKDPLFVLVLLFLGCGNRNG